MSFHEKLETMCQSILDIDKSIQSVAVINNKGKVEEKTSRPTFSKQFPDYLNELFCMHQILQVSLGRDFDESYGPINYHLTERASITILTFPFYDGVMLVITDKDASTIMLTRKIASVIKRERK